MRLSRCFHEIEGSGKHEKVMISNKFQMMLNIIMMYDNMTRMNIITRINIMTGMNIMMRMNILMKINIMILRMKNI